VADKGDFARTSRPRRVVGGETTRRPGGGAGSSSGPPLTINRDSTDGR
jgi:hypothetical protein